MKSDAQKGWLRFAHDDVLCVFNFAATAQRVPMPRGEWDLALESEMNEARAAGDVPAQTTRIYRRRSIAPQDRAMRRR